MFLDFDGTLVDIAETPDAISVPGDLVPLLNAVSKVLDGALSIVSGRPLGRLRQFLPGATCNLVAEHGSVFSDSSPAVFSPAWPKAWDAILLEAEQLHDGLLVERKTMSIALHFRANPDLEPRLGLLAERLAALSRGHYAIVNSNMTIEVKPSGVSKGRAIQSMMKHAPYLDRVPVFVADDDISDQSGFAAVTAADGLALHVGRDFSGSPARVRHWLTSYAALDKVRP